MKTALHILCLILLTSLIACNPPAPRADDDAQAPIEKATVIQKGDCKFSGEVLPENRCLLRDLKRLVVLATSNENPSGILEVFNLDDCSVINRIVLPEDIAPDFPFYLAEIMYNNQSKIVGIRGFDKFCLYDAEANELSMPFAPQYLNKRMAAGDAETGRVLRLEVWEDYLIGFAQGKGAFVYDLENPLEPKPILPIAEYKQKDESYSSLFLLPSENKNETYQAIFPRYDEETGTFGIVSLFERPQPLLPRGLGTSKNSKMIALQENSESQKKYIVDMREQILIK
ncbi:MAG: hypothetical protein ACI85O_000035 [Saprospiraceae bacterium]|jgi:hypothetical protein